MSDEALYGIAMLKIAMEAKKSKAKSMDAIISEVVTRMKLSEVEFRNHLASKGVHLRDPRRKGS
jgi:hypothetical protein